MFWFLCGAILVVLLVVVWRNRWGSRTALLLLLVWTLAILTASCKYQRASQALADASNTSTSPTRLSKLVHFDGIQSGYELDNRLASHSNTPPEALRELYQREQQSGTHSCLASNPNTPQDILQELVHHENKWVRQGLAGNPMLPDAVRQTLQDHPGPPAESQ